MDVGDLTEIGNSKTIGITRAEGNRPQAVSPDLDLTKILSREDRLVIGDPAHVPAGIYAKQALEATGQFDAFHPGRLVFADNVRALLASFEEAQQADADLRDLMRQVVLAGCRREALHQSLREGF